MSHFDASHGRLHTQTASADNDRRQLIAQSARTCKSHHLECTAAMFALQKHVCMARKGPSANGSFTRLGTSASAAWRLLLSCSATYYADRAAFVLRAHSKTSARLQQVCLGIDSIQGLYDHWQRHCVQILMLQRHCDGCCHRSARQLPPMQSLEATKTSSREPSGLCMADSSRRKL
jgi:hypothetical protein